MKKYLFLLIIPLFFGFSYHEFHLSNTKIVHNKESKTLQITMRCFIDDIENVLNKTNATVLELGNEREAKNADLLIKKYLLKNFSLSINKLPVKLSYLGKEIEKDIIYLYVEVDSVTTINHIKIENKILLETFDDQQNVIRFRYNNKKKTFLLKQNDFIKEYQL